MKHCTQVFWIRVAQPLYKILSFLMMLNGFLGISIKKINRAFFWKIYYGTYKDTRSKCGKLCSLDISVILQILSAPLVLSLCS
jgi:hypothetical protein